ncbi:MAG: hypothetical protein N3A69_09585, partial [Leptospiraceae bacterium]|nr:hypothetical protein [Leptospiraceae bacterium]
GSMPVFLDDPTHVVFNKENIIDNPMFFFGLLNDVGLLGILFLSLSLFFLNLYFKNILGIWIFFSSLLAGYHVNHPDSAFWILLMLTYLNSKRKIIFLRWVKTISKILVGILVLYVINTTMKVRNSEKVPVFRQNVLQKYQLQAFSVNHKKRVRNREIKYHNFLGSVVWKVRQNSLSLKVHFFLSDFTKKEFLNLKASYLDKDFNQISFQLVKIKKWQDKPIQLLVSKGAKFLQVDELDEKGKIQRLGKHVYSVNRKNFNEKNELISIEENFE